MGLTNDDLPNDRAYIDNKNNEGTNIIFTRECLQSLLLRAKKSMDWVLLFFRKILDCVWFRQLAAIDENGVDQMPPNKIQRKKLTFSQK